MSDRERSRSRSRSPARNDNPENGDVKRDDNNNNNGGDDADGVKLYVGNLDYGKKTQDVCIIIWSNNICKSARP